MSPLVVHQEQLSRKVACHRIADVARELGPNYNPNTKCAPLSAERLKPLRIFYAVRLVENYEAFEVPGLLAAQRVSMQLDDDNLGQCGFDFVRRKFTELEANPPVDERLKRTTRIDMCGEQPKIAKE